MNYVLTPLMLLWSSGLQTKAEEYSSEPSDIRLMGGATRCAGELEMNFHNEWKPVDDLFFDWNLRTADKMCRQLDCGSAVSAQIKYSSSRPVWKINASSVQSESALRKYESMTPQPSSSSVEITCSESVRLKNGTCLCSGRVEVKTDPKTTWTSICKSDFDLLDAEVVCRELGCGAPLKLQDGLYENIRTLQGTKEFQCRGNESTLLDCDSYDTARNTCSTVQLTCSEPDNVRLVQEGSHCAGILEMKLQGDWKPVNSLKEDLQSATSVCRQLKCGSAVSTKIKSSAAKYVWGISSKIQPGSALREHISLRPWHSVFRLEIACSDLLFQPIISISPSADRVFKSSKFTIGCSIKPQYPGGIFELIFTTSNTTHGYTQKAVNHTAYFLFPAADHVHEGNYSCVYHIYVFSHKFSSGSQSLSLSISASPTVFFTRLGLLLTMALFVVAIYFHKKVTRRQEHIALDNLDASRAEVGPHDLAVNQETNL